MIKTVCMAFACGYPPSLLINKHMAWRAAQVCRSKDVPLYTQNDVALAGIGETDYLKHSVEMHVLDQDQPLGKHVSTLWLIYKLRDVLKEQGYDLENTQVIVVAVPPQLSRIFRDLQKAGFKIFREDDPVYNSLINYTDRKSTQFWTRYKPLFCLREVILLRMPWKWYEKLTTSEQICRHL